MGLIARHLEAAGIPTVTLANMRRPVMRIKPPRTLLRRGPRGRTVGEPGDRAGQLVVVRAALQLLHHVVEPGTVTQYATEP